MGYVINRPEEAAMRRLLDANPDNATGAVLRLAWLQGLLREEISWLTWPDISLDRHVITLPDREVPLAEETEACLRSRLQRYGRVSPYVVISEKYQAQLAAGSISRLVRQALDSQSQTAVRLMDLRHDFIIRQLEEHDWPYVARISGLSVATFQATYSAYAAGKKPAAPAEPRADSEYQMWKVLQAEKNTVPGLALWLRWQMNLQLGELVALTWDQVDFAANLLRLENREVELTLTVRELLLAEQARRQPGEDHHVLLTPNSRRPMDAPRLSKLMRTVLIRGNIEDVSVRDFQATTKKDVEKAQIMNLARSRRGLRRQDVVKKLGLSAAAAHARLHELVRSGELTKVHLMYYPAGTVVPVAEQETAVTDYLRQNGAAWLEDLMAVLGMEKRQCARLLKRMADAGTIALTDKGYQLQKEHAEVG